MGLTIQDGKLVLRDGALGTEAACCCETFCCCVGGQVGQVASQEECDALGGTWASGQCEQRCCFNTGPGNGLAYCYTQETCVAAGGEWMPPGYVNYTTSCQCTHYAPVDENGNCPAGFDGPFPPYSPGLPTASGEYQCQKFVGYYINCANCNPNTEGWGYGGDSLPCNMWNDVEFLDGNPLP